MFKELTGRLTRVLKTVRGQGTLTEKNISEAVREVRRALLEADVALPVVKSLIDEVKEKALGVEVLEKANAAQTFVGAFNDELVRLLGGQHAAIQKAAPPVVILLAGLQGVGKTTTAAKLALWLKENEKRKVLLVSCDVYRPAARDQLRHLAQQIEVVCMEEVNGLSSAEEIARHAHEHAKSRHFDVLIVDTAGRLAVDETLMQELSELHQLLSPTETLFVLDAMQGQDAVATAQSFQARVPLTGLIVTKQDGDARGGAILSAHYVTRCPVKFMGVSEKLDGLRPFHPERVVSRILGMGDVLSLLEDAKRHSDTRANQALSQRLQKGKRFDLEDFRAQMRQLHKMGGIAGLMDKLPAQMAQMAAQQADGLVGSEQQLKRYEAMIDSMTPYERHNPAILKASRKRRIAVGAGVSVQEVNRLLKQFDQIQKTVKTMAKGGLKRMMSGFLS